MRPTSPPPAPAPPSPAAGTVGIVGVGHCASFLVEGLRRTPDGPTVVLSPRNAARAAELTARFGASVAAGNQAVADLADVLILATRQADAAAAVEAITFRPGQTLISVVADLGHAVLSPAAAPAEVVRAMPISCAAIGKSPTVLWPDHAAARAVLERLGPVHAVDAEPQLAAATAVAASYGWVHALFDLTADWAARHGLPPATARRLVLETVEGAAAMGLARPEHELSAMLDALATPGGMTEEGLQTLENQGALGAWTGALDAVWRRLRGRNA